MKGTHSMRFLLNGNDIMNSPVDFYVKPDKAVATKSKLYPPEEPPAVNQQCVLKLESIDKFGNRLDKGGAKIDPRSSGPGVSPAVYEDHGDGTYTISFTAAVVGDARVSVRIDNVELPPMKVVFVKPTTTAAAEKAPAEAPPVVVT